MKIFNKNYMRFLLFEKYKSNIKLSIIKYMTKKYCDEIQKIDYNEFINIFKKVNWKRTKEFKDSIFDNSKEAHSEIHASIIRINNMGYIPKNSYEAHKILRFVKEEIDNIEFVEDITDKLIKGLEDYAKDVKIPVYYIDKFNDCEEDTIAGKITWHKRGMRAIWENSKIEVLNSYKEKPAILAHELGHFRGIENNLDRSEFRADKEAMILCKKILSKSEYNTIEPDLMRYWYELERYNRIISEMPYVLAC